MPPGDSGINKPFDRMMKSFADEEPGLFLRLLGVIPAGGDPDLQPLRPETAPSVVLPDYVAVWQTSPLGRIIFHAEFHSSYRREIPSELARYGGSLAWQYQMPVESVVVFMRPEGVPADVPSIGHYDIGPTKTTHPFKVIRLWELDPRPVLETNNPSLVPWALLMKSTIEQDRQIAWLVSRSGNDEAIARFLTLGSLRYDRNTLTAMLGDRNMGLVRAVIEGSSIFREERAEARAEGLAEGLSEGLSEGRADEARKLLRLGLRAKFPDLESLPEIDRISSIEKLEALVENVFVAIDSDAIHNAILSAAS